MIDTKKLREDADCIAIAEELGVQITRRGSRCLILCPNHADRRIGSCFLNPKGYYCYSCKHHGDVFDFVMKVLDVSYMDAVKYVGDFCGGLEYYEDDSQAEEKRSYISNKQLEALGIKEEPIVVTEAMFFDEQEAMDYVEEHGGTYREIYDSETIKKALAEDKSDPLVCPIFTDNPPVYDPLPFCYIVEKIVCYSPIREFLDDLNELHMDDPDKWPDIIGNQCKLIADMYYDIYDSEIETSSSESASMAAIQNYRDHIKQIQDICDLHACDDICLNQETGLWGTLISQNDDAPF